MYRIKIINFLVTVLLMNYSISQDINLDNWQIFNTINSNIPSDIILSLANDSVNKIWWIGTNNGLAKYDGTNWTIYNESNSNLTRHNISCIKLEGNVVWLGTSAGLARLENEVITTYDLENISGGVPFTGINNVTSIDVDIHNNKWIGTKKGVFKYNNSNFIYYTSQNSGLINDFVYKELKVDKQNNVWIGTYDGDLVKYDGTNFTAYDVDVTYPGFILNQVNNITFDADSNIWTSGYGICKFDKTTMEVVQTYTINNSGIKDALMWDIEFDNRNNVWFGSDMIGALHRLDKNTNVWYYYDKTNSLMPQETESVSGQHIEELIIDQCNNVWMTTWDGLVVYNPTGIVNCFSNLGIPKEKNDEFTIYPNPVTQKLNISMNTNSINAINTFTMLNLSGQIVLCDSFYGTTYSTDIPNDVEPGMYFIEINKTTLQKIIVQR